MFVNDISHGLEILETEDANANRRSAYLDEDRTVVQRRTSTNHFDADLDIDDDERMRSVEEEWCTDAGCQMLRVFNVELVQGFNMIA